MNPDRKIITSRSESRSTPFPAHAQTPLPLRQAIAGTGARQTQFFEF
jgi:hypothetical protein